MNSSFLIFALAAQFSVSIAIAILAGFAAILAWALTTFLASAVFLISLALAVIVRANF